ncbi:malate dehydrogenase [Nocardia jiangxiensis]|uniref:malate dehydrogenase n=1 Tax=Nocardia jiangxiensis TaxID=282685 RepID=UPI00031C4044|nr:malate dehydrogenase [Nocardia jiangxiensis]
MTVFGVDDVNAAATSTPATLVVGPRDILTPLARELARELDVTIEVAARTPAASAQAHADSTRTAPAPMTGSRHPAPWTRAAARANAAAAPTVARSDWSLQAPPGYLDPPSPALHRRGAPLNPAVAPERLTGAGTSITGPTGKLVHRVVVVGAGHVGMITAMKLAEADLIEEVVLVDIADGLAAGIALDLTHSAALAGFSTTIRGVTSLDEAGVADYVVITAGRARQPGMSRTDLVTVNAGIVGPLARRAAQISPQTVLLIVTNPLDEMTHHAWQASGLPPERVLGMAGVLDSARFQALTALTAGTAPATVAAMALGSHGEEMVIPLSQATIGATPMSEQVEPAALAALVDRARNSGAEVVGLLKSGSAFFAPGASAARMVLAMATDSPDLITATVRPWGQYGIDGTYVGLPVRLGRGGVREVVELALTDTELAALRTAAARISARVAELDTATVNA